MARSSVALMALVLASAAAAPACAQQTEYRSAYHDYRVVTVVEGLEHAWSMTWLPNGDMLVTERPGRLRVVRDGALNPDAVEGVPPVYAQGQGGLLDVVLHPEFDENRLVYLSFSKPNEDGSEATTAIIRGRFDGARLQDVEEIFEADMWAQRRGHFGSRMAFDDQGYLFATLGDRQQPPRDDLAAHGAQDRSNHMGTIVRLMDDGSVPDDNPFVGQEGIRPEIWSYGHRSPQGLVIDPATGTMWETEHGPQGGDELNRIEPGLNYGWPVIGYGVNYRTGNRIHESTHQEGMEQPARFWVPSIATSGLLLYTGDRFPDWRGNLFVGGMAGQQVARLTLDGQEVVAEETLVRGIGRVRDVRQGPDGYIYLAIDDRGGELTPIVRLEPMESMTPDRP